MTAEVPARTWREKLLALDRFELLPLLTLLLLLVHAPDDWYLRTPLVFLAIAGIAYRNLLERPPFWYLLAALLGATVYLNWEESDNHRYLFVYWCLTLCAALSLPPEEQADSLALSSRRLIGLCMLFAAVWKAVNPQYLSGGFFEYELLVDERFAHLANWLAGVGAQPLATNRELRDLLQEAHLRGLSVDEVQLTTTAGVRLIALILTWWTLLIEVALAVLFLARDSRRLAVTRNVVLLAFAASTYAVANVRGFGWMLMLLGLAQCGDRDRGFRCAFLAGFLLIQLYTFPATQIAAALLGR